MLLLRDLTLLSFFLSCIRHCRLATFPAVCTPLFWPQVGNHILVILIFIVWQSRSASLALVIFFVVHRLILEEVVRCLEI